jgi:Do/DeqQ family serine protease
MKSLTLAAAMACAALTIASPLPARASVPAAAVGGSMPSLAPMIKEATKSVVNISSQGHVRVQQNPFLSDPFFRQFFGGRLPSQVQQFESLGSGVIINADKGYILTNNHVIAHADKITVTLNDGRSFDAKVVGKDPQTDIAVVQIKADNLTQIKLGDSTRLQVGDFVVAIGNPFALSHTATFGIVSGLGRSLPSGGGGPDEETAALQNYIQTDASINPGNSGGALVNLHGELVGVNTAILSKSGGNIGIGFAIPIDMAKQVMDQIIKYGKVEHGLLGVTVQALTPDLAKAMEAKVSKGALVSQVMSGSAAAKAGIKQGDIIVAVNGHTITSPQDLQNAIGIRRPGTEVHIKLLRNGETREVEAKLGAQNSATGAESGQPSNTKLGASFSDISPNSPLYGQVQGAMVVSIDPEGEAARAGLRPGDVIVAVQRHPVKNVAEFRAALGHYKGTVVLTVERNNQTFFTTIR